jgi:hypothetical protein
MYKTTTVWSGFQGAPGYTVMYFDPAGAHTEAGAGAANGRVRTFFAFLQQYLSTSTTLTFNQNVDQVDPVTGELVNSFSPTQPGILIGTGTANQAAAAGACVTWRTPKIVAGKRLRGRTFIVPLSVGAYEPNGTLTGNALGDLRTAAAALVADSPLAPPRLCVWHRPIAKTGGDLGIANAATVADKTAVLTSRRD